uniref:Uncharacterized protein n=1 Tax=Heterorhabditis bacteriophora TaxID=37862 RepID=A0A1I7XPD7_HETBA
MTAYGSDPNPPPLAPRLCFIQLKAKLNNPKQTKAASSGHRDFDLPLVSPQPLDSGYDVLPIKDNPVKRRLEGREPGADLTVVKDHSIYYILSSHHIHRITS